MALLFGAGSTDVVDFGSGTSINDLHPLTMWCWCRPTTFSSFNVMISKHDLVVQMSLPDALGNVAARHTESTGDTEYKTDDTPLSLNTWHFVAAAINVANATGEKVQIYVGSLTASAVESTYGTTEEASGGAISDAAGPLQVGNRTGAARRWQGDIACFGYIDAELTLGQILALQFRTRVELNTKLFSHLGFNGTGAQPDWSGNGNSGTVTGATVSDHVPLGPSFGFDLDRLLVAGVPADESVDAALFISGQTQPVIEAVEIVGY